MNLEALNESVRNRLRYLDYGPNPFVETRPKFVDISGRDAHPGYVDLFVKYVDLEADRRRREFWTTRRGGYNASLL